MCLQKNVIEKDKIKEKIKQHISDKRQKSNIFQNKSLISRQKSCSAL